MPGLIPGLMPLFQTLFFDPAGSTPWFEVSALIMAHGPPMAMREIGDNACFGAAPAPRRDAPAGVARKA
jgi:hypothetical protein